MGYLGCDFENRDTRPASDGRENSSGKTRQEQGRVIYKVEASKGTRRTLRAGCDAGAGAAADAASYN